MKKRDIWLLSLSVLLCLPVSVAESQVRQGKFGFGISGSGNILQSDWKTNDVGLGASADLTYSLVENWGLRSSLGFDTFTGKNSAGLKVLSTAIHANLAVSYDFMPHEAFNPFVFGGGGLMFYYPRIDKGLALLSGNDRPWDVSVIGGVGFDYFLDEFWSITVSAEAGLMGSDNIEGYAGGFNDTFGRVSIGVRYYLFDKDFVKRMIEAFEKRGTSH